MKYIVLMLLLLTMVTGCANNMTAEEKAAVQFISKQGYELIGDASQRSSYVLTKEMLRGMPYNMYWSVQETNPEDFLGREIVTVGFELRSHPLQDIYDSTTMLYVVLSEGKAIGGYSWPNKKRGYMAGSIPWTGKP